ncbi:conserved hypothetical protein [Staphylococcus epidermidis ATCC 12228]|uniref:Uncharacterized protein n=1 Tax=Staphylococcus epidermidis (strain ATCC 12228 / FDA PCI 1200) TaxID=176280 RepID=A0A0H2VH22_STAES|nr:conserved hypothetical protein [Staphylococcus epidermidis ATCC 12228]
MSSYPLYYPMPKAILAYRDIISLFQGGLHTIITSVSEISGISAKTLLTCSIICGPNGHPIEVNVISTVHKPSSSTSTLYTKPKLTISIPNSGSITISRAPKILSFSASSISITSLKFSLHQYIKYPTKRQ